jgi:hypothetical protein
MTIEIDGVNNTLKTDKIEPQSGTALQLGASGDTLTLPSGATLNIAGTISNSGTATGFGAVDWQTSDIKTSTFTPAAGKGYFVNTTGGAITVNLPAGSAGTQIALIDYAGTWDDNNCTVSANGSEKIQGSPDDAIFSRDREALQLVYVDSTQGWLITSVADQGGTQATYIVASGGTETTSGDYKIHTFTSTGTFTVSSVGNAAGGGAVASYAVVGGGAGGGAGRGGGGGAGGFREGAVPGDPYYPARSPLAATSGLTLSAQAYPITVGAGGNGGSPAPSGSPGMKGNNGVASVFSTVTSAGGGLGSTSEDAAPERTPGGPGGSGGGGSYNATAAGNGNTPPVSPPQGNNGGAGVNAGNGYGGGGGGGSASAGTIARPTGNADGGNGVATSITGSPVSRTGGGGGAHSSGGGYPGTPTGTGGGGTGGGGAGGTAPGSAAVAGSNGTANTGGGGGGGSFYGPPYQNGAGGAGGSGTVIIRYKYQN